MHRFNPITEGLIKAMGFMAQGAPAPKPKWYFRTGNPHWVSSRTLSHDERVTIDAAKRKIEDSTTDKDTRRQLIQVMHNLGQRLVEVRHATKIDHSRYQGETLAMLKKYGGAKEQARAARRREAAAA